MAALFLSRTGTLNFSLAAHCSRLCRLMRGWALPSESLDICGAAPPGFRCRVRNPSGSIIQGHSPKSFSVARKGGAFRTSDGIAGSTQPISGPINLLKTARVAHGAMVAGFTARFHAADLLFLKVINQLGDDCFFHPKLFLTGMRYPRINTGKPG